MKKMLSISALIICTGLFFSTAYGTSPSNKETSTTEPIAGATCRTSSSENTGVCKKNVGSPGDSCVVGNWYNFKNCIGVM